MRVHQMSPVPRPATSVLQDHAAHVAPNPVDPHPNPPTIDSAAPNATGAAPNATGAAPNATGAAPNATGAAPNATGAAAEPASTSNMTSTGYHPGPSASTEPLRMEQNGGYL